MVYPIATAQPTRSQDPRAIRDDGGDVYSSPSESSLYSPSSSSSSSYPNSPLTSRNSATAPLSQQTVNEVSVSQFQEHPAYSPQTTIFPLFTSTQQITSRNVRSGSSSVNSPSQRNNNQAISSRNGLPYRAPHGFATPNSYQNALSNQLQTSTQDQLLQHHDLPRSLPPLPNLSSNLKSASSLQHSYLHMLAQPSSSTRDSSVSNQAMPSYSVSAANSAAESSALDALFEQGVYSKEDHEEIERWLTDIHRSYSSPLSSPASSQTYPGDAVHAEETLTFDALFAATAIDSQQTQANTTAPSTPQVHDASAFTTMQGFSSSALFDLNTLVSMAHAEQHSANTSPVMQDIGSYSPPSASNPPALYFSPTSPYDHAALQATPSTGLTMDMSEFDGDMGDMPLFGFADFDVNRTLFGDEAGDSSVEPSALGLKGIAPQPQVVYQPASAASAQMADLEGLIAMSGTPSVMPIPLSAQLSSAPLPSTAPTSSPVSTRRPTGHRKNLAPSALLPVDAPTQPRSYRGPSATSRKDIPAFALASSSAPVTSTSVSKKRKAVSQEPEEDDEDDLDEPFKPRMGESEIEAKRRQNTLAARRSRHRKLAYVRELEEKVVGLMGDNERMREAIVRAGIDFEW